MIIDTKETKHFTVTNGMHKFELVMTPEIVTKLAECQKASQSAQSSADINHANFLRSKLFAAIFGF